jgi:hypothetical protein
MRLLAGEAQVMNQIQKHPGISQIFAFHKIGSKSTPFKLRTHGMLFPGPGPEFMGQSGIADHVHGIELKAPFPGKLPEFAQHGSDIHVGIIHELLKAHALGGDLLVQRQGTPDNDHIIFLTQGINTPGTEVAPGSDKIGKHFQAVNWLFHKSIQNSCRFTSWVGKDRGQHGNILCTVHLLAGQVPDPESRDILFHPKNRDKSPSGGQNPTFR